MVAEYLDKVNWDVRIAFLMQAVKTNTNKKSHMQQVYCGNLMKGLITIRKAAIAGNLSAFFLDQEADVCVQFL